LILKRELIDGLLEDVKEYVRSEAWYRRRGIPWRRGYLLYGPPGTGKSSLVSVLAAEMNMSICLLNLGAKGMTDELLNSLLHSTPASSLMYGITHIGECMTNRGCGGGF